MAVRTPKIKADPVAADEPAEIVRGTLAFATADGVTTITGDSIEAGDGQHLNVCFNGRTYHAVANPYAGFTVAVPAFEGEVEVWTADKQNPRLVAKGAA